MAFSLPCFTELFSLSQMGEIPKFSGVHQKGRSTSYLAVGFLVVGGSIYAYVGVVSEIECGDDDS